MEAGTKPPEQEVPETSDVETTADGKPKSEERVPYERLEQESKRARKAEAELAEMRDKILQFEDRDKSETERDRAARERAESQLTQLQEQVTSLQKGAWVRSAAAELKFHDPEDAVAHLSGQLAGLEDAREAKRAVQALAKSKAHLVQEEKKPETRPSIGRVLQPEAEKGEPQHVTPAQAAAEQDRRAAEGLAAELKKFTDNWHELGS